MKDLQEKYNALRKEYPFFEYQSYSYSVENQFLKIVFSFNISHRYFFSPTLVIPLNNNCTISTIPENVLRNAIFHMGMIELISYWKCTCAPLVIIRPQHLDQQQIEWWK
jgi:hypothetical protein